jgi:hypothetical protein
MSFLKLHLCPSLFANGSLSLDMLLNLLTFEILIDFAAKIISKEYLMSK